MNDFGRTVSQETLKLEYISELQGREQKRVEYTLLLNTLDDVFDDLKRFLQAAGFIIDSNQRIDLITEEEEWTDELLSSRSIDSPIRD